ncbi:sialate O-acetylesterase-like [Mercenaria mercenaria]|uniref:sialate O-acetylesterase-like n=1 Tax=Mercenaria mercenaria TaxID=6596 RepID=UPI00234F7EB5|nr:sialate O-acetylesterase-like [Mercenaria mercenaria]
MAVLELLFCFFLMSKICSCKTPLSLASYYGDNMVLQKAPASSQIWGYADMVGSTVTVTLGDQVRVQTTVYMDNTIGRNVWKVLLPPQQGHGPVNITVTSGFESLTITNVMFGDVWLCSGQSNMKFTLSMVFNASEEVADAVNYPDIRLFTAAQKWSNKTEYELLGVEQYWSMPNSDSVGHSDWSYFSAVCWLFGKYLYKHLQYPIGLIATDWGGTPVEAWSSKDAMEACEPSVIVDTSSVNEAPQNMPTHLWNSMIHPFLNLTIYGAVWYQGEANMNSPPDLYKCRFPVMIDDWRKKFHEGSAGQTDVMFPFGFVQLAPWRNDSTITKGFPDIRWEQTCDFGYVPNAQMPQVFMATAIDLPDFSSPYTSIHPRDKQDVAYRLVLSALQVAYNIKTMGKFLGPMINIYTMGPNVNTLRMIFDNGTSPIKVKAKDGFEICCSDNNRSKCDGTDSKWLASPIVDYDNTSVTITSCYRMWTMGVRYAWRESPCPIFKTCAVYSKENDLPMPPYMKIFIINGTHIYR